MRLLSLVLGSLLLVGCRIHTTYDGAATSACTAEASDVSLTPTVARERFDDCCHRHQLDSVEPGSRACGKLGLDALVK